MMHVEEEEEEEAAERKEEEDEGRHMYRAGEFKLSHATPQCGRCRRAIELVGASGDPTNIDGLYVPDQSCFMHYNCYKAEVYEENARRVAREDTIVADMKLAIANQQVQEYCTFDWTNPADFRYCAYCKGQLTARWSGYCYPCSDTTVRRDWRNYGFIHFTCYDAVQSQGKYNPEPVAKPPRRAKPVATTPIIFKGVTRKMVEVEEVEVVEEIESLPPVAPVVVVFKGTGRWKAKQATIPISV